jgi:UDP-N-acetyl-2-amino-2-deoxyglucuronate dehydrogenase
MKPKFAMVGCGYVSHKHLKAISDVNGELIAVLSKNDIVGHLDSWFNECKFFMNDLDFQECCKENKIDWLTVISPNHMHKQHIEFGLRNNINVICEKPLCLFPSDLDDLIRIEKETGKKVFSILQLRLHKEINRLREIIKLSNKERYKVNLRYVVPRGDWYGKSWKSDINKSGGILLNLAIHAFDIMNYTFGHWKMASVSSLTETKASGYIDLENAYVEWFLSTDKNDLIEGIPNRCLSIGDEYTLNLDKGFTELHTNMYKKILAGEGYGIEENRIAIEMVCGMRDRFIEVNSISPKNVERSVSAIKEIYENEKYHNTPEGEVIYG